MTACLEHSASNLWPLGPGYRCSPLPPTWISVFLDFSFDWVWLWIELFVVGLWVFWSCDQRSAICLSSWHLGHSGYQTLYRVRGCTFSCRHHFWLSTFAYRSENLPLKYEQLVLLPFGQHLRLTAVEQDWVDQGLVNGEFCLAWKMARLQTFEQSEEAPICSLDSSLYLQTNVIRWSPIATLCPASRIVLSFQAAIVLYSFIFNPSFAAFLSK
jgi:hypothetical protein